MTAFVAASAVFVVFFETALMTAVIVMAAAVPGAVSHFTGAPGRHFFCLSFFLHGFVDDGPVGIFCID